MRLLDTIGLLALAVGLHGQERLSPVSDYATHPSMAVAPGGDVYVAWISYDQQGADEVRMKRYSGGQWSEAMTVSPAPGDYFKTSLAVEPEGRVWVAWAARVNGNVDLYARTMTDGRWSRLQRLTEDSRPDIHHRMVADGEGRVYLCWQSFRTGDANIYLRVHENGRWGAPIAVTTHEASDWEPAVALDPAYRLYIVYDTYRHGDYDVYLRVFDRGRLSEEYPIAATGNFEARATVACDREGRTWVAWDDQGPGWGLDRPLWKADSLQGDWGAPAKWALEDPPGVSRKVSLRYTQKIGTAIFFKGRVWTTKGKLEDSLPAQMALSYEIPHLTVDSGGTPWMFFRRWIARNDGSSMAIRPGGWDIYATRYSGEEWTAPVRLEDSTGSNDQRVATAMGPDGKLWVAYPADGRRSPEGGIKLLKDRHGKVNLARLDAARGGEASLETVESPASRPYRRTAPVDRRNTVAAGEKRYQLYWGDLHRHTEISFDGGYDGTLWDMYRYAMDVAELDFIATTDHFYGGFGQEGAGRTYDWWRTQKAADLLHVPGKFMPLFGYERSLKWPYGHRNVINLKRGTTAFDKTVDDSSWSAGSQRQPEEVRLWKAIRGQDVITIPHTIASGAGTDWSYNDPALEPLMEIYQGCRMSYEAEGAPRVARRVGDKRPGLAWSALAKGYKVGFIASSDHRSTHISYAAVYAEEPTRESLFRGMQQRHAYAATDNIVADVRLGEAILGDVTRTSAIPELHVAVRGTGPLREIQIIKNGAYVYRAEPAGREVSFTFRDNGAEPGESYYYVRVQQEDGQMAWISPIWVEYRP